MQIIVDNLTYTYSEGSKALAHKALDGVSLTINEGEFFGIIGKTGSGKSTFVQHLNGLIKIGKDKGKIIIGDVDLTQKNVDYRALRAKIGMVFQYPEAQLFAETVFSDVAFGLKNFFTEMSEEDIAKNVEQALTLVGLDYEKVKNKSPFELSGGQKRRVAIAGVIVTKPEILVLDEPAAGLDPVGKRDFIKLLRTLHSTFVKTIIIVSHDMDLVAENCTGVAVFANGKIVKQGAPKQVFSDAEFIAEQGLELPLTAKIQEKLAKRGVKIDSDLTVDGFISAYLGAKGVNKL